MKKVFEKQVEDLTGLIMMVKGDLTKPIRQKIMCMITMDAHSRDIIEELDKEKVSRLDDF
jgi:dynein heavy chain